MADNQDFLAVGTLTTSCDCTGWTYEIPLPQADAACDMPVYLPSSSAPPKTTDVEPAKDELSDELIGRATTHTTVWTCELDQPRGSDGGQTEVP